MRIQTINDLKKECGDWVVYLKSIQWLAKNEHPNSIRDQPSVALIEAEFTNMLSETLNILNNTPDSQSGDQQILRTQIGFLRDVIWMVHERRNSRLPQGFGLAFKRFMLARKGVRRVHEQILTDSLSIQKTAENVNYGLKIGTGVFAVLAPLL